MSESGAPVQTMSAPDRTCRRLRWLALCFVLLGGLGVAGHYAAYPDRTTVAIAELTRDADGFLTGDFERPWPLKINKHALDEIRVMLADGTELQRAPSRAALAVTDSGFLVNRPEIVFRLDGATADGPDEILVILPVKTRDILYQLPFGIVAVLLLVSWPGLRSRATMRALWWRPLALAAGSLALALDGLLGLYVAKGPAVWLALLVLLVGPLIAATILLRAETKATGRESRAREPLIGGALLLGTVLGACILAEAWLGWQSTKSDEGMLSPAPADEDWFQLPDDVVRLANARTGALTLPDAWRRRDEKVEGATSAYVWHGALHLHDEWGFRRLNGPFPAKDPGTLRVMVVGDSLTYGYGVEEQWTFSRLLQRSLQASYRVEVVNLGRSGFQSKDIVGVLQTFLPQLDPDLVVYAVCLNDFLPSGERIYDAYPFPFPETWKEYLWQRTRLGRLFDDAWRSLLLALDLRHDFFEDILTGGKEYPARFARDVAAMNRLVQEEGLPPIIGIVFEQSPGGDQGAWKLIEIAERAMADAGFDVISVMPWRGRLGDRLFRVSRWESHPNELAHSLIAERLDERLRRYGTLEEYRIDGRPE
jgi:GDSL-like Lipase/Acylhydrolase family